MNRRSFLKTTAVCTGTPLAIVATAPAQDKGPKLPVLMKAGHQHDHSAPTLRRFAALGVNHICSRLPSRKLDDNWSVAGLKRFIEIVPSPWSGLNFCQGTISEMMVKPAEEIFDVIRYFGSRRKIFIVHFRNIKSGFLSFQETFPDDGDVDMPRALRVYRDVGYDGMIMPDHVPLIAGDTDRSQPFSFCHGYIQALLQALKSEA